MNISNVKTKNYKNLSRCRGKKTNPNKPNSNPISERPKMNLKFCKKMAYENKCDWTLSDNKPNQTQFKPNFRKDPK